MPLADLIKIPWNKHEAVLLVDAYLKCCAGELPRTSAVAQVSKRLRDHMKRMGVPISEAYRNEAGISLQMSAIEYLFTDGACGISHVSNLFRDIVDLYRSDQEEFNALLSSAVVKYPLEEASSIKQSSSYTYPIPDETQASILEDGCTGKYVSRKLYDILLAKFPRGYRLGSYMEVSRLKDFYKKEYEEDLELDMKEIDADVKACGIEYEGRVYIPENMLPIDLREDLLRYISGFFDSGKGECIFYSVLFDAFHERFLDGKILSPSMLRQYLEFINMGPWYFSSDYFSITNGVKVDILREVVDYVKSQGGVVAEDEVVRGLVNFPEKDVRLAFDNRDANLISCGRNVRFHIDNFVLSQEELASIESIIRKAIKKYRYISFSELLKDIQTSVPTVASNNAVFGDLGLRNALAYKLAHKFSFTSNIISDFNNPIKAEDTFVELAKRERFTLDDISSLANDCGTIANVYIEVILQTAVRVEKELYVSKDQVSFDVEGIDAALMRFCTKDYIAFPDISTYSSFPDCNFQWNPFLLESYVAFYSKAFKLVHARYFGQKYVTGAIVKRGSSIKDFSTLAAYAVADSDFPLNKKDVLEFLADNWYIAQRRTEEIDTIIVKASQIRLNKQKK